MSRLFTSFVAAMLAVIFVTLAYCLLVAGDNLTSMHNRVKELEGLVKNLQIDQTGDLAAIQQLRGIVFDLDERDRDLTTEIRQLQIQVADLMQKADTAKVKK